MRDIKLSTIATVILAIVSVIFAVLGFAQAANSQVAPIAVSGYMVVAALCMGGASFILLRRDTTPQRFMGIAAVVVALYFLAMALVFFAILGQTVQPF